MKDLGSSQKAFKSPVKDFMTPKGFSSKIKSKICSTRKSLSLGQQVEANVIYVQILFLWRDVNTDFKKKCSKYTQVNLG